MFLTRGFAGFALAAAVLTCCVSANSNARLSEALPVYEIRLEQETQSQGSGSSGSSRSKNMLIEKVIMEDSAGLLLEFDLPPGTDEAARAREWMFPARIRRSPDGKLNLVNADRLKERNARWLRSGGYDESACGRWVFTWTAIKIECDPQAILDVLQPIDLRFTNLKHGGKFEHPYGAKPGVLALEAQSTTGKSFRADFEIDAEKVRRDRAETDVTVAAMMGQESVSFEHALAARKVEKISGSIQVVIEVDEQGMAWKRIDTIQIQTEAADSEIERETTTSTVERVLTNQQTVSR
jgi:hypothetical protein